MKRQSSGSLPAARHAAVVLLLALLVTSRASAQGRLIHIIADRCLPPNTAGLTATVAPGWPLLCGPYVWTLSGGTITAGQGTNAIIFTSGPAGTALAFHLTSGFFYYPPVSPDESTAPGSCRPGAAGWAQAETYPIAQASGDSTICPGLGARLIGSGGLSCEWTPADGLSNPHSCTPLASPSQTTTYNLVVSGARCASSNEATATVTVSPGPGHALTVDHCLPPDAPGLVASLSGGPGESYVWEVPGGTITSGQATNAITFSSGPAGGRMRVSVAVTGESCAGIAEGDLQVDFTDVSAGDIFYGDICTIAADGITAGCGSGAYCRDASVRRDQMAALILRAEHGDSYWPPPCSGRFGDVPCPGPFTDWVEQLHAEGITGGCHLSPPLYCPDAAVTRGQMATFLVKTFELH